MQKSSLEFLKSFLNTSTPSGFESQGQRIWRDRTKAYADSIRTDVHGNVIAIVNEKAPTRIMLAGHCDEIGLMATYIDENGFIYFGCIGGVDAAVLPGMRVRFLGPKGVVGVIGRKPIHLMEKDEREKGVDLKGLWIDIGARDRKQAQKFVEIGNAACVLSDYQPLLNDRVASKAWDDKAGAFVVSEVLRLISEERKSLHVAVYGVSTVQEELGLRGAITSGYGIAPHAAIAIDVGFTSDSPGIEKKSVGDIMLGKGPILHRGANTNIKLSAILEKAAQKKRVRIQWSAEPRIPGTDADALQLNRGGVATALVSIPNRYMHTPVELCDLSDLEDASKMITQAILSMPAQPDFMPY